MAHTSFLDTNMPVLNYELVRMGDEKPYGVLFEADHKSLPIIGIGFSNYLILADQEGDPFGVMLDCPKELMSQVGRDGVLACGLMENGRLAKTFSLPTMRGFL